MPDDLKMDYARLLRDQEGDLKTAEAELGHTCRSLMRQLTAMDEFDQRSFDLACEDLREQFPEVAGLRENIRKIRARLA